MIIYIDKTIAEHEEFTDDEELMFTDLACAHRHGDCYLCGAPDSIDRLKRDFTIFRKGIDTHYAEMGTLINAVETLIVISYDKSPVLPQIISDKKSKSGESVRIFSVEQAIKYRINKPCILLGESLYDCDFYRLVMRWYMHSIRKSIRGVCPNLIDEPGSGDSTNRSLEKCVRINHNLTICLTDSDKKYDRSQKFGAEPSKGNTARYLIRSKASMIDEGLGDLFELYCLDVHEAENLIPFCVLDDLAMNVVKEATPGIVYLRKLQGANLKDAILFYDLKKGNNIEQLREESKTKSKKKPELAYWEEIAQQIGDESAPCVNENILSKAIQRMKQPGYLEADEFEIDDHLLTIWNDIGRKVFSWGCANIPNATRPAYC